MDKQLTKASSGISCCGDLHWGAHFCHLYETREDLVDTLVPFFTEGLRNHEQCLWVTSEPLDAVDAAAVLAERIPDLRDYLTSGQLQIVDHSEWHTKMGHLDGEALLQAWVDAEQQALAQGYNGLRATGNVTFLKSRDSWRDFERYESRVTETFAGRRLLGLCSYHLGTTNGNDVLDVLRNHQFAVARRDGQWEVIENAALKLAKDELHRTNRELEQRVAARTSELRSALATMEAQRCELEAALRMRDESQRQVQAELEDARLLQRISATLVSEEAVDALYQKLVDAAVLIMRSDFGSMQRFDSSRGDLQLLAHHGFTPEGEAFWEWVTPESGSTCALTLRRLERVVISDIAKHALDVGSDRFAPLLEGGIRAAQTTPLLSRSGEMVGAISTHWLQPHQPSERDLRLLDIVARQAADLIERNTAAAALRAQTVQLMDADRRKDEFLATLAHELRNPLAPLQTGLGVLQGGNAQATARVLPMMERQLANMVRLIDDLLDVSRVSRGMVVLKRERATLKSILDSAIETSRPLLEAANHRFTVTTPGHPVWVDADVTRLAQVISNLLNNAAKYTPPGGRVELVTEVVGNDVVIRVVDNGVGIPARMLSKIFDLFVQVEQTIDKAQGGLGLGLSLATHLVTMHGGTIEARSGGSGQGSVFIVRLPVAEAPEATILPACGVTQAQAPSARILIVDDNVDAAETLSLLLDSTGHETRVICDAEQALQAALEFRPDVAFLDLGMPRLSGFDLARLMRTEAALSDIVLVAVSGWGTEEDRSRSREAGINHHLTKPASPADIQTLLARVMRARPVRGLALVDTTEGHRRSAQS